MDSVQSRPMPTRILTPTQTQRRILSRAISWAERGDNLVASIVAYNAAPEGSGASGHGVVIHHTLY